MIEILNKVEGTAAQRRAALSESVTIQNPNLITIAVLIGGLTLQERQNVLGTFKQVAQADPLIESAWLAMSTAGIQLHTDERQQLIDTLASAGNWSDELKAKVKAIGRPVVTRWQSLGGTGDVPSVEEIEAALAEQALQQQRQDLQQVWQPLFNQHIAPVLDGDSPTAENLIAGLRAAANALEG